MRECLVLSVVSYFVSAPGAVRLWFGVAQLLEIRWIRVVF